MSDCCRRDLETRPSAAPSQTAGRASGGLLPWSGHQRFWGFRGADSVPSSAADVLLPSDTLPILSAVQPPCG